MVMKSIIQENKECYVCGTTYNLHSHHIYFGNPGRKLSEKYGMKVYLCWLHHEGTHGVHGKHGHELDMKLKKKGQEVFEKRYPDLDFKKIFGKNYL